MSKEIPQSTSPPQESSEEENLTREAKQAEGISSFLFKIYEKREEQGLDPLFTLSPRERPYLKDFLPFSLPQEELKSEEVKNLQNKTVALIFEVATQALEPKPKRDRLKEDTESLMGVWQTLNRGEKFYEEIKQRRPEETQTVLRELLVKRRRKKGEPTAYELKEFETNLSRAKNLLRKKIELLQNYFSR